MSTAFDPNYPTAAARSYRDLFVAYAAKGGLQAIPEDILSWAIDRAIQAGKSPQVAGLAFADTYYRLQTDSRYQERVRRCEIHSPTGILLSEYEKALTK